MQGAGASSWAVSRGRPGGAGGPGVRGVVHQYQHQTRQSQHFTAGGADPVSTAAPHIAQWASPLLLLGRSQFYRFIQIFLKFSKIYDQILKIFVQN